MTLFRLLALLLIPLALSGCEENWTWRQKLTVVVETPDGDRSGSSVLQGTLRNVDLPGEMGGASSSLTGEAVVVEVLPGRYLFVLLKGMPTPFPVFYPGKSPVEEAKNLKRLRASAEVPPRHYPLMVTFDDVTDPATVRRVDPADLAAVFGPGVVLKSVVLEVTDEPMTEGRVEAVLGWWLKVRSGPYNEMTPLRLPNNSPRGWDHLSALDFWSLERVQDFSGRDK